MCPYFPICKMGVTVAASRRVVALVDNVRGPPGTVLGDVRKGCQWSEPSCCRLTGRLSQVPWAKVLPISPAKCCIFIFLIFYLFLERGGGRKRGRETSMCGCLLHAPSLGTRTVTQACALAGNRTRDPLLRRPALNPLSHTSQGQNAVFLNTWGLSSALLTLRGRWCANHLTGVEGSWRRRGAWQVRAACDPSRPLSAVLQSGAGPDKVSLPSSPQARPLGLQRASLGPGPGLGPDTVVWSPRFSEPRLLSFRMGSRKRGGPGAFCVTSDVSLAVSKPQFTHL